MRQHYLKDIEEQVHRCPSASCSILFRLQQAVLLQHIEQALLNTCKVMRCMFPSMITMANLILPRFTKKPDTFTTTPLP